MFRQMALSQVIKQLLTSLKKLFLTILRTALECLVFKNDLALIGLLSQNEINSHKLLHEGIFK